MARVEQTTSEEILYKAHRDWVTTTIIAIPSTATVTLTASGFDPVSNIGQAQIKTPKNTTVHYSLEAPSYTKLEGDIIANVTQNITINMNDTQLDTFTIVPTPSDATVTLTAPGYTQEGNSITVLRGTQISYNVSREGYETALGNYITSNYSEQLEVELEIKKYTLTITPYPSDATVTLTCPGFTQTGNSIKVEYGNTVHCVVSKVGYNTAEFDEVVLDNETLEVDLTNIEYTVTINPTPSNATVTLTCPGYTQVGNKITVHYGDTVNYSVSKENYVTQTGSVTVTSNVTIPITLHGVIKRFTVSPTPSNATVTLTSAGATQVGNYIDVEYGSTVYYEVSKEYYTPVSGSEIVIADRTASIVLQEFPKYTLTINPVDSETLETIDTAIVEFSAPEGSISARSIEVHEGTTVNYKITAEEYEEVTGSIIVNSTITLDVNVELSREMNWFAWKSEDEPTYYAWSAGDEREFYTVSETPSAGDTVYNKNKQNTGLIVDSYSEEDGIVVRS